MKSVTQFFHYVSYLQYPIMLGGLYVAISPYINGFDPDTILENVNSLLVFMGLSISFSTLQDTTKTQNEVSKRVWEDPKKGRMFIITLAIATFLVMFLGLIEYVNVTDTQLKELSFGFIVLGISLMGLLKAAIEMFENHRLDKNSSTSTHT